MFKVENKLKKKLIHFMFNFRVSFYCDHKRVSTYTFASFHINKTKCN